jgi:hypothetical protein
MDGKHPLIVLALLLICGMSWAQAPQLSEESYVFDSRMTADEACSLAEQALKRNAVARQCGSLMTGGAFRALGDSSDSMLRLHFETTGGRVVEFERTARKFDKVENDPQNNILLQRCTIQARVAAQCDQGQRDPGFIPAPESQVVLNESVFREGEAMKLDIAMPVDLVGQAYVSVLQLLPYLEDEKRVWRVYPNIHHPATPLTSKALLRLPNEAYSLETALPKGRKSVEEALMIVFSRVPLSLPDAMTIEQFHRTLSELTLNMRREVVLGYRIESSGGRQP